MSLGDDEHPISFLFQPKIRGEHVHVTVRAGQKGMRALVGTLTFRGIEWAALRELLGASVLIDDDPERPDLGAMLRYAPKGAYSWLEGVKLVYIDESPLEIGASA